MLAPAIPAQGLVPLGTTKPLQGSVAGLAALYAAGENALIKLIYCACQKILEKWDQPMHNWALIVSQLQIFFEGRLKLGLR